jgi:hypothetical protein
VVGVPRDGGGTRTGQTRRLAAKAGDACLAWAPDGKHLSISSSADMAVLDLTGHRTVLDKVKKAQYSLFGLGSQVTTAYSTAGCGGWLDGKRLAFDRLPTMPKSISIDPGDDGKKVTLKPDTSAHGAVRHRSGHPCAGDDTSGDRVLRR